MDTTLPVTGTASYDAAIKVTRIEFRADTQIVHVDYTQNGRGKSIDADLIDDWTPLSPTKKADFNTIMKKAAERALGLSPGTITDDFWT